MARKLAEGVRLNSMTKHMLGLFNGRPGARAFRRHLSENATREGAGIGVLRERCRHAAAGSVDSFSLINRREDRRDR